MADVMKIEVLENGMVKVTTDKVSMANHQSAEAFLRGVVEDMGGEAERVRRGGAIAHEHDGVYHTHE